MNGMKKVEKIGKIIGITFLLIGFLSACIYFTVNDDGGKKNKKATSDYILATANDYSGVVASLDINSLDTVAISDIATSLHDVKSFSRYDTKVTSRTDSERISEDDEMNPENVPSVVASIEKEIQQEIADKGKVDLDEKVEKVIDILQNEGETDVIPKYLGKDEKKQKEYLKAFIKASYSTKFPDLNSDKSELDGIVKFKRGDSFLEYKPYDEFVELVNNNRDEVANYFSLKYENQNMKLILATWLIDEEGNKTYSLLSPINYQKELNLFAMPFDFIWAMLVVSSNKDFAYDLANLAINESSEIVITVFDTTQEGNLSYNIEDENTEENEEFNAEGTTTLNENIVNIAVTEANTWLLEYSLDEETPKVKEKLDKDSKTENFVTIFNKEEYTSMRKNITSGAEWLYEILRESEDTVEMVDTVKYILYKATNNEKFAGVEMNWEELVEFSNFGSSTLYAKGTGYWWPVGGSEIEIIDGKKFAKGNPTSTTITSKFGAKENFRINGHGAIDISNGGTHWIIASADGTVVKADGKYTREGSLDNDDGGTYGNHVIIDHGGGIYTLYAHMAPGSLTVQTGDVVKQGQVIGQMGHTGRSTAQHLHFEVRKGGNALDYRVDPEEYVNANEPRPVITISSSGSFEQLKNWLSIVEGGREYITDKGWIVFDPSGGDDTMNLAFGIVVASYNGAESWYPDVIPGKVHEGNIVSEEAALYIWQEKKLNLFITEIEKACMKYNITLNSYQRDACISFIYRIGPYNGNTDNLIGSYAEDGEPGLWNYMKTKYDSREIYEKGTKNRVAEEYELFTKGDYTYQNSGTSKYNKFCNSI